MLWKSWPLEAIEAEQDAHLVSSIKMVEVEPSQPTQSAAAQACVEAGGDTRAAKLNVKCLLNKWGFLTNIDDFLL